MMMLVNDVMNERNQIRVSIGDLAVLVSGRRSLDCLLSVHELGRVCLCIGTRRYHPKGQIISGDAH